MVYALAGVQDIVVLDLAQGAVAGEAAAASGLLARHGLTAAQFKLGISGKRVAPGRPLREGDRVEILRDLAASPGEARRLRVRPRPVRRR